MDRFFTFFLKKISIHIIWSHLAPDMGRKKMYEGGFVPDGTKYWALNMISTHILGLWHYQEQKSLTLLSAF